MTTVPPIALQAMELARRGDVEQAIARGREAVEANPQDAGLRAFLAMLHIRRNELSEALSHLRSALAIFPNQSARERSIVPRRDALGARFGSQTS